MFDTLNRTRFARIFLKREDAKEREGFFQLTHLDNCISRINCASIFSCEAGKILNVYGQDLMRNCIKHINDK